jgi:hypothetical protein
MSMFSPLADMVIGVMVCWLDVRKLILFSRHPMIHTESKHHFRGRVSISTDSQEIHKNATYSSLAIAAIRSRQHFWSRNCDDLNDSWMWSSMVSPLIFCFVWLALALVQVTGRGIMLCNGRMCESSERLGNDVLGFHFDIKNRRNPP